MACGAAMMAGRTWKNIGLKDSRHIMRIVVHPRNPDIVWVAVMGHLFGPSEKEVFIKQLMAEKHGKEFCMSTI